MTQQSLTYIARLISVALVLTTPSVASAQSSTQDSRWSPWVGCWQPVTRAGLVAKAGSLMCVTPVGASGVEVAAIDSGNVVARDTIDTSGAQRPVTSEGCTGTRSGEWSADGRRVYLRSSLNCSGGTTRVSSGMLAFVSSAEWMDVQNVRAGSSQATGAARYIVAGSLDAPAIPAEFSAVLRTGSTFGSVSRVLAGGEVQAQDVVDASKHVDAAVVQTWIIERDQPFALDAKTLLKLADAGVPGSVTDVMIGVTFPYDFVLSGERESRGGGGNVAGTGSSRSTAGGYGYADWGGCTQAWDAYWYLQSPYDPCYRTMYRDAYSYGYGRYGYGRYDGYGSFGYYTPIYTGDYNGGSVVVVDRRKELPRGTVVNGQGYTRGRAPPDGSSGSSSGSSSSPPQRTSGSGSSGSSSSGSSGGGRTAHKKGG